MKTTLIWNASFKCPENQLTQIETNKFNIYSGESTYIKSILNNYTWEDGELLSNLDSSSIMGAIQLQDNIRLVNKVLVNYCDSAKKELLKVFNKIGFIEFKEIKEGFLFSNNIDINFIKTIKGVNKVQEVAICQRKKYKPTFISTGIYIDTLPWHILNTPTEKYNPYLLANNKVTFSEGEIKIALYPVNGLDTIVPLGELIAELMFFTNDKEIELIRKDNIVNVI